MKFLDYSNDNHINIIPQEEFEGLIKEVFGVISSNITKSLGPLGSSATILDGMHTEATKDGYTILKNYRLHNRYKKMIYNLIQAPCTRMNNTVGDGTTTAIALTTAIFNRYERMKNTLNTLYRLPREFTKAWDEIISELISRVEKAAKPISSDDTDTIYNIAYVTSNGNKEIATAIADVYKSSHSPSIMQKDSPTNTSYIESVEGFEFPANMLDVAYAKNEDLTTVEKNIAVMIFDYKIETDTFVNIIVPINKVMKAMGKKLLVLAPSYDRLLCDTQLEQYLRYEMSTGGLNLVLGQYQSGKVTNHQVEDLAVIVRAKHITQTLGNSLKDQLNDGNADRMVDDMLNSVSTEWYHIIGNADEVILSMSNGSIFKNAGITEEETYKKQLTAAKAALEDVINHTDAEKHFYSSKIYDAKSRVIRLEMKNYIYYVGADTQLQKQIIWDAIEDVIKCLRSATKTGVVPGCQITIAKACLDMINELNTPGDKTKDEKLHLAIISLIYDAICDVYIQILHGPFGDGMIKTLTRWEYTDEAGLDALKKEAIDKGNSIVAESIKRQEVFDLETLEYNSNIITSAQTDTMVLSVASDLVKILTSGSQCIYLDADVNEAHQEEVQIRG